MHGFRVLHTLKFHNPQTGNAVDTASMCFSGPTRKSHTPKKDPKTDPEATGTSPFWDPKIGSATPNPPQRPNDLSSFLRQRSSFAPNHRGNQCDVAGHTSVLEHSGSTVPARPPEFHQGKPSGSSLGRPLAAQGRTPSAETECSYNRVVSRFHL